MITKVAMFSFKVPTAEKEEDRHPDAGKKIEKSFEYQETTSEAEAMQVLADKKWSLKELVDEALKSNARASAYQTATIPYKPSTVAPEDIKERMIKDFIRLNMPEDMARKQVEALLASIQK